MPLIVEFAFQLTVTVVPEAVAAIVLGALSVATPARAVPTPLVEKRASANVALASASTAQSTRRIRRLANSVLTRVPHSCTAS